jgi:hypothetical protein
MALSEMRVFLLHINTSGNENDPTISLKISCKNVDHYNSIVSRLRSIDGVNDITRDVNGILPFGDASDFNKDEPEKSADTSLAYYGRIISEIKRIQPKARAEQLMLTESGYTATANTSGRSPISILFMITKSALSSHQRTLLNIL